MKSPEEQMKSYNELNQIDLEELNILMKELDHLKTLEINLTNLVKLENAVRSLGNFKDKYNLRIINMLRKGWTV